MAVRPSSSIARLVVIFGLVAGPGAGAASAADGYDVLAITPPPGRALSKAYGINNLGQVVGRFHNHDAGQDKDVDRQAFIWSPASGAEVLSSLGGECGAWGVNDVGQVSGFCYNASGFQRAVRWDTAGTDRIEIGTLVHPGTGLSGDTSTAFDINNLGEVTGCSDIPNDTNDFMPFHAFLYDDASGIRDLGTLNTTWPEYQFGYSVSYDVNANHQVVGLAHNSAWEFRPYIYDASNGMQELARDAAYGSGEWYAVAINDNGRIGGHVIIATDQSLPYYWPSPAAAPVAIPMPAAFPYGEIYGVNASGAMVGVMWNASGVEHAFVYDGTDGLRDLNDLIDSGSGWVLAYARDINDAGSVVGFGELNGVVRGFILTPSASPAAGQITGTVIEASAGAPLEGVRVSFFDMAGSWVADVQTTGSGNYTSPPLPAASYFVATDGPIGLVDELYDDIPCTGCDPTTGDLVSVTAGSSTVADFVLVNPTQPAGPVSAGNRFRVNSLTTYGQGAPSVSIDGDGNFFVVWLDYGGQDGDGSGVFGRLFSNAGTPVGNDFQVNSFAAGNQSEPSVSMDIDGDSVVVWTSDTQDGSLSGVFGQRFAADGTPAGNEFVVPTVTEGSQSRPSVAMKPGGDFVVVWDSVSDIAAQQFLSDGTPLGSEFPVNSFTSNAQSVPAVAADSDGNFVVVWESSEQDGSGTGVFGQRFAGDGGLLGGEFQVNTTTANSQSSPRIAVDSSGDIVVIWEDPGAEARLAGRRFSADGTPLGGQFQAGAVPSGYAYDPSVAADQDGNFVVVWQGDGIEAQAFSRNGTPLAPKMDVSNSPSDSKPSVAMNVAGEFVVAWVGDGGDSSDDIFARRFRLGKESDELTVDFGSNGLWYHDGATWKRPTPWNPEDLEAWQDRLAVDFGAGRGVYFYDRAGWHQMTGWDPYALVSWGHRLVAAFGAGRGLYVHDSTKWSKLTSWEPARVVAWGDQLVCDFGPGRGLQLHDGVEWKPISSWVTTEMIAWWDKLAAAFDSNGLWIYRRDIGWTKLSNWQPEHMVSWADDLVVDFGSGRGIWSYDSSGWRQLSAWDPYLLVPWRDKLAAAFDGGRGVYFFNSTSWDKKTSWEPVGMEALSDKLVADFGPGRGIYTYDTAWKKLTAWSGEMLAAINLHP